MGLAGDRFLLGKELAGGQRLADPEDDKRSGRREEREHEESRIAAAAVRSRGWGYQSSKIRPGVGYWADCWFGPYPMWPKRVGYTYPTPKRICIFRIRLETYPRRIRIQNVSDTDTPPPGSIRVTEVITWIIVLYTRCFRANLSLLPI